MLFGFRGKVFLAIFGVGAACLLLVATLAAGCGHSSDDPDGPYTRPP